MSDNRSSQIAGGMPPAAKYKCIERHALRGLVKYAHLANGIVVLKKASDRFEQAEQGLQLLLFAIINTFIFEAMKTDRLRFLSQTFPTNFKAMCR